MSGYNDANGQYSNFISFINIVDKGITRLPCFNVFESSINISGKLEKWTLVTVKDIEITAGCNEWKIPITKKIGDVEMPIELYGKDEHKLLRNEFSFNIDYFKNSGLMHFSKPSEVTFNILEDLVVDDQWRVYWEYEEEDEGPGAYKVTGLISGVGRVFVIEEAEWEVVANQEVDSGTYEITGLGPGEKLVVGRKADGQSYAYGKVTPVLTN
jgi:hypothetical protein